jgi:hypothetical protein
MFGGITALPRSGDIRMLAEALRDPKVLERLAAEKEGIEVARGSLRQAQREAEGKAVEREAAITRRERELEAREAAWSGEEARRRSQLEAQEKAIEEKNARSEALLVQRTHDAAVVAEQRKALQHAVDRLAA